MFDISKAKASEAALQDSEAKYRTLIEQLPAVVYVDTFEDRPVSLYVSPQTERISGYRPEEWMSDPDLWLRVVHPDDRQVVRADWAVHVDDPEVASVEYRIVHRDGHIVWCRDSARLVRAEDGTPLFCQGVILDVTAEKEREIELRRSEARYRALVEQVPAFAYIDTDEARPETIYVGPQVLELLGYTPEEWSADQELWMTTMHAEDQARVKHQWDAAIASRTPFACEYRAFRKDGQMVWLRDVARLEGPDGEAKLWHGLIEDITDSRQTEEALRESEIRYRTLVEQVPAIVFIDSHEESPACLYVRPQSYDVLGYAPEEYQDDPAFFFQTIHPEDRDRVAREWVDAVRHSDSFRSDFRVVHRDGSSGTHPRSFSAIRTASGASSIRRIDLASAGSPSSTTARRSPGPRSSASSRETATWCGSTARASRVEIRRAALSGMGWRSTSRASSSRR